MIERTVAEYLGKFYNICKSSFASLTSIIAEPRNVNHNVNKLQVFCSSPSFFSRMPSPIKKKMMSSLQKVRKSMMVISHWAFCFVRGKKFCGNRMSKGPAIIMLYQTVERRYHDRTNRGSGLEYLGKFYNICKSSFARLTSKLPNPGM